MRVKKELRELTAGGKITGRTVSVLAKLEKDGSRSLIVDGKAVSAQGPALDPQPALGLSVGEDQDHNVGEYKSERYKGAITDLILEVQ
ncbi:MAG: hypothetical protein ACI8W8_004146 [Rhodothermales bacterium]